MERKTNISSAQFFLMMFVSRVVVTIALNAQYLGGENMVDSIAAYLLSMVLGFFIALPIWILNRKYPYLNVGDVAKLALGKAGKLVPVCYILYFVLTNGASLALFEIFLLDTVNPDFSSILVLLAIVGVALYGAFRGIETISRCATCVFAVLLLGVALVFGIVLFRFRTENLEPLFAGGLEQTARSVMLFVARTSIFADMAVLLPMVRGEEGAGILPVERGYGGFCVGAAPAAGRLSGTVCRHSKFSSLCVGLHHGGAFPAASGRGIYRGLDDGRRYKAGLRCVCLPRLLFLLDPEKGAEMGFLWSCAADAGDGVFCSAQLFHAESCAQHFDSFSDHPVYRIPPARFGAAGRLAEEPEKGGERQ